MPSRDREDRDDHRERDWPQPARSQGGSSGIGGFAHDRRAAAERQPGSGRPPRAYRRSDERIRDDVYDRLMAQDWIDAADVLVTVADGEITLAGTVPSRQDKRDVEELADSVLGVREIHNQLRLANQTADQAPVSQSTSPGKAPMGS
jgi:hypothetical protein